jgi:hypothetical protein
MTINCIFLLAPVPDLGLSRTFFNMFSAHFLECVDFITPLKLPIEYRESQNTEPLSETNRPTDRKQPRITLSTGLGHRASENPIPRVFGFTLYWNVVCFCFFGTGLSVEGPNPAAGKLFTLPDFQPENRILVMTICNIFIRHNRWIYFFEIFRGGRGTGLFIGISLYKGSMTQSHLCAARLFHAIR